LGIIMKFLTEHGMNFEVSNYILYLLFKI